MSFQTLLLTFLGTGNYQSCAYALDDNAIEEHVFFSAALAKHLNPEKVISLQTSGATCKHGDSLDAAFAKMGIAHDFVSIPDGHTESELWRIFAALTNNIPTGCKLHLDITHGFRSLPLLGFIALSYLRTTRKITIGGIHYGAWEARNQTSNIAPVFDLTPFLTLLDWTAAADQFLTTGSATLLGDLLSRTQQTLWQKSDNKTPWELPRKLKSLGSCLQETSSNLILLRTGSFKDAAAKLTRQIEGTQDETANHASPFLELLQPVKEQLALFNGTDLVTLRDLVGWLADRGQTAAALTLASEWLTSYIMVKCGYSNHHASYQTRKPYSLAIAKLEQPNMEILLDDAGAAAQEALNILRGALTEADLANLAATASTIRNARNDLNHAGFNDSPATASALIQRSKDIAQKLTCLP